MDTNEMNKKGSAGFEDQNADKQENKPVNENIDENSTKEPNQAVEDQAEQSSAPDDNKETVKNEPKESATDNDESTVSDKEAVAETEKKPDETPAKEAEKPDAKKTDIYKIPDKLDELNKQELLEVLKNILEHKKMLDTKDKIEQIKALFYRKHKAEITEKKSNFINEGGSEDEFDPGEDNAEVQFKELYSKYKELKSAESQDLEAQKELNLKAKYDVIEEIKDLINRKESINKTFNEFRELQNRWREIGLVPQGELKNLWETYHHHVEKFYDYIKINKELRDLDLKKNMEAKIELCEKAEKLILEPNIPKAFKELQELHNLYREIGPAPADKREEVWQRFKEATSIINKKHQEFYENLKEEQKKNLVAKEALCEKVEKINEAEYHKPKKWEEKTAEVIEMQKLWKTIGFAPKKDNNKIYKRFKAACDEFFNAKRAFYEKNKEEQKNNLQMKTDLCVQAEAVMESTDWKNTTKQLIELQKKWKEIGPVPRKYSESVWKRFRTACDTFFTRKSEYYTGKDGQQEENLKLKLALIEKVRNFKPGNDNEENLKLLMDFQKQWTQIGFVPLSEKDKLQKQFRDTISEHLENLDIDKSKRILIKFKQRVEQLASSNAHGKLESERNKIITKLKDYESEIALYENNIGFFAKSKNAESLIGDVTKKIEKAQNEIEILKGKLKILNEL